MPKRPTATATKSRPAEDVDDLEVEEEEIVVESDDEVDDLEVEDEPDEEEPAPKKRGRPKKNADGEAEEKPAKEKIEFGSAWLAEHVNSVTGSNYNAFGIRTLLRKLVKDGVLQRDVGVDRSRYNFPTGAEDATVQAVIKAVQDGSAEKEKKAKIEEAKQAAAAKQTSKQAKSKKAEPVEDEEDEEDDTEEDVEDL